MAEIDDVDINPQSVSADGRVTADDALVALQCSGSRGKAEDADAQEELRRIRDLNAAIEVMTHPKSIAVIGAWRTRGSGFPGIFNCIKRFGFPGKLYPINPKADEIDGIKAYPNLVSLPEPVDLVVVNVPAPLVPDAFRDCVASGNRNVHVFTSGFKETGEQEGERLQEEIERIAIEGGLRVVGPNCMGFYVPVSRLLTWVDASTESGPVAFVSQSGGNAQDFTSYASDRLRIHFSKVISYGNALTLDSTDFMEYLARDYETRVITMYLEGVKDGRKLLRQVTDINRTKPVIVMKGGLTESGARAVASHTGSMAGGEKIWQAFFRQTGAVRVDSLEEMAGVTQAFLHFNSCGGKRISIIGTGGGVGVMAADSCSRAGLELPALSPEMMTTLREFIPPAGNMIRNPIDAHIVLIKLDLLGRLLDILSAGDYLDMFIISLHLDWLQSMEEGVHTEKVAEYIAYEARKHINGKPLAVVWRQYQPNPKIRKRRVSIEDILLKGGVPVYEGLSSGVFALAKLAEYHTFQRNARVAGVPSPRSRIASESSFSSRV